jgi:hypothetical protein
VDVFGRSDGSPHYTGVQARNKVYPPTAVTATELCEEVDKAKKFVPTLRSFVLATTAPNDATIQQEARRLTEANEADGLFSVEVWGWDEIESRLAEFPDVIRQHYPQFTVTQPTHDDPAAELVRVLKEQVKWAEESDRPTFERTDGALSRLAAHFRPTWKIHQASGDYVPNLEWRFCGPRFRMDWRTAGGSRLKDTTITEVFDLTNTDLAEHPHVGADEIGLEVRFPWRGKMRHEIHRWPLTSTELPKGVLWDVGREILPVARFDLELGS